MSCSIGTVVACGANGVDVETVGPRREAVNGTLHIGGGGAVLQGEEDVAGNAAAISLDEAQPGCILHLSGIWKRVSLSVEL